MLVPDLHTGIGMLIALAMSLVLGVMLWLADGLDRITEEEDDPMEDAYSHFGKQVFANIGGARVHILDAVSEAVAEMVVFDLCLAYDLQRQRRASDTDVRVGIIRGQHG